MAGKACRGGVHPWGDGMAILTVTSNLDNGDPGTFRAVLASAAIGDTITFNGPMTILLTQGQLNIGKNLTILGDLDNDGVPDVTVDGQKASRVIETETTVRIDGLVVANGKYVAGAGITAAGQLTLTNSILRDNEVSSDGGALFNAGTTTVINTTVSNNRASQGGGIFNQIDQTFTVINSTLLDNTANAGAASGVLVMPRLSTRQCPVMPPPSAVASTPAPMRH